MFTARFLSMLAAGTFLLAPIVFESQSQPVLNAQDVAAAIDLGVAQEPGGYPLHRYPGGQRTRVIGGYAYTPYVRAAFVARDLFLKSGVVPAVADVQNNVNDSYVYIALLDFALTVADAEPGASRAQMVIARRLEGGLPLGESRPTVLLRALSYGVRAQWAKEVAVPGPVKFSTLTLKPTTRIVAAFPRTALAGGGYLVAEVARTYKAGQTKQQLYWAELLEGEPASWR
jgi:hypothetical protein